MDIINYIILISACINLLLGILVFFKSKRSLLNVFFSLFALSVVSWSVTMIMYRMAPTIESSIIWCKALYISPVFIVIFLIYFAYLFPRPFEKRLKSTLFVLFGGGIAMLSIIIFTDRVIRDVIIIEGEEKKIIFGFLYYIVYSFFISGYFLWLYLILFKRLRKAVGIARLQLNYIFWGIVLGSFAGMFTNLLLPTFGNFSLNWMGQISSLVMVALTTYAIILHHLMDIKLVLRKSFVYLGSLSTVLIFVIGIEYLFSILYLEISTWVEVIVLVLALSVFPAVKGYYYRVANKYFFSSLYDSGEVIANLSDKLRSTIELERIYQYISDTLIKSLRVKAFGIISLDEKKNLYIVKYNKGFKLGNRKRFPGNLYLRKHFTKKNESIVVEELKRSPSRKYNKTVEMISSFGTEILTPMNIKDKTVGLIVLGAKESGDMYNDEDLGVLKVIGAQAAIAIENALLYEEARKFSVKLEKEVTKATADLRAANEKLKELDKAKSEFISIASHQLRTPLTIIKGYISMMLEGSFGELTSKEIGSLEKVYKSNERLIQLVENLLNISRIESGRLQFNYEIMNIGEVVDSVVEEIATSAERSGLSFTYKKPSKALPEVKIDNEKIRQAVLNLIDNAIKYTKKGSVTVSLGQTNKNIEFCVSDSGIGVQKRELKNLFKKFSRGDGTSLIHTEGIGLGLYVARIMIEAHKGRIWAESKGKEKGSKFCFTIPINK